MTNAEQREAWNGVSGDSWVATQEEHDATLAPWGEVLAETAVIRPGERVLDIGCGCGATTRAAAASCAPGGTAVGVDLSVQMLARARDLADAAGLTNTRFVAGDAQVDDLTVDGTPYDVVISRYGVMFFDDPVAAFANMARATGPGGRLAMVVWAPLPEQQWMVLPAAAALPHLGVPEAGVEGRSGMFAFSDPERTAEVLGAAGWSDVVSERRQRRMAVGGAGGIDEAMAFLLSTSAGRALFADAAPDAAEQAQKAMRDALAPHLTATAVELDGVAWSVTARRAG